MDLIERGRCCEPVTISVLMSANGNWSFTLLRKLRSALQCIYIKHQTTGMHIFDQRKMYPIVFIHASK